MADRDRPFARGPMPGRVTDVLLIAAHNGLLLAHVSAGSSRWRKDLDLTAALLTALSDFTQEALGLARPTGRRPAATCTVTVGRLTMLCVPGRRGLLAGILAGHAARARHPVRARLRRTLRAIESTHASAFRAFIRQKGGSTAAFQSTIPALQRLLAREDERRRAPSRDSAARPARVLSFDPRAATPVTHRARAGMAAVR